MSEFVAFPRKYVSKEFLKQHGISTIAVWAYILTFPEGITLDDVKLGHPFEDVTKLIEYMLSVGLLKEKEGKLFAEEIE